MEVLWERGSASVGEVAAAVSKTIPLAYSTVLTTLRVLENKAYLRHTKQGRAFIYKPIVQRAQARDSAITHLVRRFFGGSPELLMLNLVEGRKIDAGKLEELRRRIAAEEDE